jgi:hypothetical protein
MRHASLSSGERCDIGMRPPFLHFAIFATGRESSAPGRTGWAAPAGWAALGRVGGAGARLQNLCH